MNGKIITKKVANLLRDGLNKHHDLYKSPCKSEYLENQYYNAFLESNHYQNVIWNCGSHNRYDIILQYENKNINVSIKSGLLKNNKLLISGYRLSKYNGCLNHINNLLLEYKPDIMITTPFIEDRYKIFIIDPILFSNPIDSFNHTFNNGINAKIHEKMSYQIWWEIPIKLCQEVCHIPIKSLEIFNICSCW